MNKTIGTLYVEMKVKVRVSFLSILKMRLSGISKKEIQKLVADAVEIERNTREL